MGMKKGSPMSTQAARPLPGKGISGLAKEERKQVVTSCPPSWAEPSHYPWNHWRCLSPMELHRQEPPAAVVGFTASWLSAWCVVRCQLSQVDETVIKPGKEIPSPFILFEPARGNLFIYLLLFSSFWKVKCQLDSQIQCHSEPIHKPPTVFQTSPALFPLEIFLYERCHLCKSNSLATSC